METKTIFIIISLIITLYTGVLLAIVADLWSALRKARQHKIPRTSRALRRTVEKIASYYNCLIALTIIDAMLIISCTYLNLTIGWHIPPIPIFTLLGSIALSLVEVKSICEKSKDKGDFAQATDIIRKLLKNPSTRELITWLTSQSKDTNP